jgi:hypothetical protein
MSDNGAESQKNAEDMHNYDTLVSPADTAQVMGPILENQRTHCISPIPPE